MINLKKIFNFKKKKILITGATGKVGRLLSITFASCGADLILTDLSNDKLLVLKKNIQVLINLSNGLEKQRSSHWSFGINRWRLI